jgi:hypothetical protein
MARAASIPIVLEVAPTLEPTTRDDFADEPSEHRPRQRLAPPTEPGQDGGERQE